MFRVPAKLSLQNIELPPELLPQMTQEDEGFKTLEGMQDTPCTSMEDDSTCTVNDSDDLLSNRVQAILHERGKANQALVQQAKRMKTDFDAKFPQVDVG